MSISFQSSGQFELPTSTALSTTNQTDVFTASSAYTQKIAKVWVTNEDTANEVVVTLEWNDGSTDYTYFVGAIPAQGTVVLDLGFLLSSKNTTHKLKATADTANKITVTVISVADRAQQGRMQ